MDAVDREHVKQDVQLLSEVSYAEDDRGHEGLLVHTADHRQADRMMSHGWLAAIDHAEDGNGYDAPLTGVGAALHSFYEDTNENHHALLEADPERFVREAVAAFDPESAESAGPDLTDASERD